MEFIYTTTVKLNSQEAKKKLQELQDNVTRLSKASKDAFDLGNEADFKKLSKELAAAEKQLKQFKSQTMSVQDILNNLGQANLKQVEKVQRSLRNQWKITDDPKELEAIGVQLQRCRERIDEFKAASAKAAAANSEMTKGLQNLATVMGNIDKASYNQLKAAQEHLKKTIADANPQDTTYATAVSQLKEVEARMVQIEQQQKRVNTAVDQYEDEIRQSNRSLEQTERETRLVQKTMNDLSGATLRDIEYSLKIINEQLRETNRNSPAYKTLSDHAAKLKKELHNIRKETEAAQPVPNRVTDFFNRVQGSIVAGMAVYSGLKSVISGSIKAYADMDEAIANMQKYTGLSDEQAAHLNETLKKMDTRTSREELNELAGAAGRLGITSEKGALEFVDAADKISVALGDDLGEGAVDQVGKLAMAFGEDDKMGLRGAMLATGSAVNELAQNSSANAGYLVDFTARVAGVGRQFGLTQAQIMGYGAVMDENMLRDEMASTAFANMMSKMRTETSKFAKMAGMDIKEFTDLVNNDFNGAIMALADNIKAQDSDTMFKMLNDMGLDGARAVSVLSTLADKIDDVRSRQKLAEEAYKSGTSVVDEFNKMNDTAQAKLDKARKAFREVSVELGESLQPAAAGVITVTGVLVRILATLAKYIVENKQEVIVLTGYIIAMTVVLNAATIAEKAHAAAMLVSQNVKKAYRATTLALKSAVTALHLAYILCTKGVTAYTVALNKAKAASATNPWTALAVVILTVGAAVYELVKHLSNQKEKAEQAARATDAFLLTQKKIKEVQKEANTAIAEEVTKLNSLRKTLEDNKKSIDERKKALAQIKKIVPEYHGQLTKENKLINNNSSALDGYVTNLRKAAEAQAAFNKMVDIQANNLDRQMIIDKKKGNTQYAKNKLAEMGVTQDYVVKSVSGEEMTVGIPGTNNTKTLSREDYFRFEHYKKLISANNERINQEQKILDLNNKQLDAMQKIVDADPTKKDKTKQKTIDYVSDNDIKAAETAANKQETERKKALKKEIDDQKAANDALQAENLLAYHRGEQTWREYNDARHRLAVEGYDKLMAIYKKYGENYQQLTDEQAKAIFEREEDNRAVSLDDLQRQHQLQMITIQGYLSDRNSALFGNEEAVNEALFQQEMDYLQKRLALLREGSEEWIDLSAELTEREEQHKIELRMRYQQRLLQYREQWGLADNRKQEEVALRGLDELLKKELLSVEEAEKMKQRIKEYYASERAAAAAEQNGPGSNERRFNERVQTKVNTAKAAAGDAYDPSGKSGTTNPLLGSVRNYANTMEQLRKLYANDTENYREYQAAKRQVTAEFLEDMAAKAQMAFDAVNNIMSAASGYYAAQSQYEQNVTSKKYDKMIEKAGSNNAKAKKLEEQKQKELAKIKTKYNKKQMKIEIAQAYASTAMAAINSYASASKVSWVLGAIAAAMATAAGMLQIATIKKQHAAEEAGYYSGGFTGGSNYRKRAGVVHEGEFVVNHQGVENPNIMPLLNIIDRAQRNNTIGTLTQTEVSRQLGQGGAVVAPMVNVMTDNSQLQGTLDVVSETVGKLNERLSKPIRAVAAIDGPDGIDHQLKVFNKLKDRI